MKIKGLFILAIVALTLNSCLNSINGNGNIVNEKREIDSFKNIEISGAYEIILNQGIKEAIELKVDENLVEIIETKVTGETLHISTKGQISRSESLQIYVTVVDIENIDLSGAVELKSDGQITSQHLEIESSGASEINLKLLTRLLEMDMSGASDIILIGEATVSKIDISGAGELNARQLKTKSSNISISGAGNAIVFIEEKLKVDVSGAGSVRYFGDPEVEKSISGAGSVSKL